VHLRAQPNELEALCARRLRDGFFVRAARWYGLGIAASYALALGFAPRDATTLLVRALGTLAWIVGGILALASARDSGGSEHDGLLALARQRGFAAGELARARFSTAARRIALGVGGPALVIALVPWLSARSFAELTSAALRTCGALAFALTLGVTLAALARGSAALAPERGRATLLGLVLVPHAARSLWPELPSVPSLLAAWLELLVAGGAT
jgi:hypothetical protein